MWSGTPNGEPCPRWLDGLLWCRELKRSTASRRRSGCGALQHIERPIERGRPAHIPWRALGTGATKMGTSRRAGLLSTPHARGTALARSVRRSMMCSPELCWRVAKRGLLHAGGTLALPLIHQRRVQQAAQASTLPTDARSYRRPHTAAHPTTIPGSPASNAAPTARTPSHQICHHRRRDACTESTL